MVILMVSFNTCTSSLFRKFSKEADAPSLVIPCPMYPTIFSIVLDKEGAVGSAENSQLVVVRRITDQEGFCKSHRGHGEAFTYLFNIDKDGNCTNSGLHGLAGQRRHEIDIWT